MAHQSSSRFVSLIVSTLVIAMVLIAGVIFYKSATTVYNRSHAGETSVVYKQWEFEKDTEGWESERLDKFQAVGGNLEGVIGTYKNSALLKRKQVDTNLPAGNKNLTFFLTLDHPISILDTGQNQNKPIIQEPSFVTITYWVRGKKVQKTLQAKIDPNGDEQNISVKFPEIGAITLSRVEIEFPKLPQRTIVRIAWIRLVGTSTVKPTPTSSCQTRPSCLDTPPYCRVPEPAEGWCPPSPCIPLPPECDVSGSGGRIVICEPPPGKQYCPPPPKSTGSVSEVCTQEAKQCPNGTYVSRTGPNCEFAPCPVIPQ